MELTRLPTFNVDKLEGAVEHMLQVCGALSDEALNDFARRYAYQRGKKLPANYAKSTLLPRLKRSRRVFQTTYNMFSLNPLVRYDPKGNDAFWVFLEYMEGVDLDTVMSGPYPAKITYIKNNKIYHIVPCTKEGSTEMGTAALLEMELMQRQRKHKHDAVEERFIFVFSSDAYMRAAPFSLKTPSLFCSVTYENKTGIPKLFFAKPDQLDG